MHQGPIESRSSVSRPLVLLKRFLSIGLTDRAQKLRIYYHIGVKSGPPLNPNKRVEDVVDFCGAGATWCSPTTKAPHTS